MRSIEKGMSMYASLLKRLSMACRGDRSVKTIKAITTATSSFVHRLKDMNGMSDQKMLTSM